VTWTGEFLQALVSQTPVVALLLIMLFLDRRDHKATLKAMQDENAKLQAAVIDHLNRTAGE
jgi:hypothetical protein